MEIKLGAFPSVYINTVCTKHECPVEIHITESKKYNTTQIVGAAIRTLRCKEGGIAGERDSCSAYWQMSILGGGEVTISE